MEVHATTFQVKSVCMSLCLSVCLFVQFRFLRACFHYGCAAFLYIYRNGCDRYIETLSAFLYLSQRAAQRSRSGNTLWLYNEKSWKDQSCQNILTCKWRRNFDVERSKCKFTRSRNSRCNVNGIVTVKSPLFDSQHLMKLWKKTWRVSVFNPRCSFYSRDAMLARVFATAKCLSVSLSVRPSVVWAFLLTLAAVYSVSFKYF